MASYTQHHAVGGGGGGVLKKRVSKRCGGGGEAWDILENKDNEGGGEALLYVTAQFNNNKTDLAERRWELGFFIFCKSF